MTPIGKGRIAWGSIGRPLEDLLRYEGGAGYYEKAGYELISKLVNESDGSAWRRYLTAGQNLSAVVEQVLAISNAESTDPKTVLDRIREVVDRAYAREPLKAIAFLDAYLQHRPALPDHIREKLDALAKAGRRAEPLRAAAFMEEVRRLSSRVANDEGGREVLEYWVDQIARGEVDEEKARNIPGQVLDARDRLLGYLRGTEDDRDADYATVYARYSLVFRSHDIPAITDLVLTMHGVDPRGVLGLGNVVKLDLEVEQVAQFMENLPKEEVERRFARLGEWMATINNQNHDGVVLTPVLTDHLAQPGDFEALLGELDRLRAETRKGRFRMDNPLQRHLEYRRYSTEYNWQLGLGEATRNEYSMFEELRELPSPTEEKVHLDEEHIVQLKRLAYEAHGFLLFLREFLAMSSRPIVVVGNDRYGRQWVVEPLEDYLEDDFTIRYYRAPSHKSMRMTVRSSQPDQINLGFAREFIKEISTQTPHIVIVDTASPRGDDSMMRLSRATRDYANWFAAFNDVRAEGDVSRYEADCSLSPGTLTELRKWHEYVVARLQLKAWVAPGPTYKIAHWAPVLRETVMMGDYNVPRLEPDLGGEAPLVVLANPAVYLSDGQEVPDALKGSSPSYFDDPERLVKENVLYGFGSHGFESRVVGPTTEQVIDAVQREIKVEIGRMLEQG